MIIGKPPKTPHKNKIHKKLNVNLKSKNPGQAKKESYMYKRNNSQSHFYDKKDLSNNDSLIKLAP